MLGSHGTPRPTGVSVTLKQSGAVSTVFRHLPMFGIIHHTPGSPVELPSQFSKASNCESADLGTVAKQVSLVDFKMA